MIKNMWYGVLPAAKVKGETLVAVRRMGLDLVFFRDKSGKVGALVDQCSHRGAALSLGKHTGDCVQCPFHALQFDPTGACQFIPANGKANQGDLHRYNVKAYPIRERHGILYLWYGEGEPTTELLPFFEDYITSAMVYSEIEDTWDTHYSRAIENQLDVVHVPFVHHNTIGRGNRTLVQGPKVLFENETLITSANNEVDKGQALRPAKDCEINATFLAFRFPNVWMNHISEKIKVIIYFAPVDDEQVVLYLRFYTNASKVKAVNQTMAYFGKFANRIIERQDKRIVITQRPKASSLRSGEKLIAGDGPIVKYRQLREHYQLSVEKSTTSP